MTLCEKCKKNKATSSAIVQGIYYQYICNSCKARPQVSSGAARWNRTIDAEDHEAEIQQPYNADGSINAGFAKMYPKQAKAIFSDKQIRDANR